MSCEKYFIESLKKQGFRLTTQREIILGALHKTHEFVSVEEIQHCVSQQTKTINISTTYRTLELLVKLGFASSLEKESGKRLYALSHPLEAHTHLVCSQCGTVIPIPIDTIKEFVERVIREYEFKVEESNTHFNGLCNDCANAKSTN